MVVKSLVKKAIANTLERARLKVEEEIKKEKQDMMEEALRAAEAQYLASDGFGIVKVNCF